MIGGPYQVLWSKKPISKDSTEADYQVISDGEQPSDATKVTLTFTIPEATFGQNFIEYLRRFRPEDPYNFIFNVVPDIQASPSPAAPASQVTFKGTGYPAATAVKVTFDGKDTGLDATANDVGTFSAQFTIPNCPAGQHEFTGTFGMATTDTATGSLTVGPMITLDPDSPDIGQDVTVAGNGFAPKSPVSLKFDTMDMAEAPDTDSTGSFSCTFKVPVTKVAKHTVIATDADGNTARFGMPLETTPPPSPSTNVPTMQGGGFGDQLVTFAWTDVTDPSGVSYTLEIGDNLYFFPLQPGMRKTGLDKSSITIKLSPGTYYWHVKAIDGAGNESGWALAPYPVKVGGFSSWYLIAGGLVFLIVFIFVVRAFFRRVRQYYK